MKSTLPSPSESKGAPAGVADSLEAAAGSATQEATSLPKVRKDVLHGEPSELDIARLDRIKKSIRRHYPPRKNPNHHLLIKAFKDAERHHQGQMRKSGEPYIFHPARVALMASEAGMDLEAVIIALLHDVIEDTKVTKKELETEYGHWLAEVVDGLSKAQSKTKVTRWSPQSLATYRKLISSTIKDLRTLQVKIFDRLDNMRDLGYLSRTSQRRISTETLNVYAPMAQRLGMQHISEELTALGFRYLYPKRFKTTLVRLKQCLREEGPKAESIRNLLESQLKSLRGLRFEITPVHRPISDFVLQQRPVERSLAGFKVRVRNAEDCYRALGVMHMAFRVVPNSIKDYISNPKPNRYQALHSHVFLGGEATFIAVMSEEMERVNASGILAGWDGSQEELAKYYESYLNLLDHLNESDDLRMEDVLRHAQMDALQMFTPKGEPLTFPQGATVLDFAFAIHTDLGTHCQGARMGGRRVSRFEELRDGEMVEIISLPSIKPTQVWLDHVGTTRAKLAIRRVLKAQANQRAQDVGHKLLDAELRRLGRELETFTQTRAFKKVLKTRNITLERLFQEIGMDKIRLRSFLGESGLIVPEELARLDSQQSSLFRRFVRPMFNSPDPVLRIGGPEEGFIRMGDCCAPLEGDPIVGVQTEDGITIHRTQCPALEREPGDSLIDVGWESPRGPKVYRLDILLKQDQHGLLYKVSKVMRDAKVNIIDLGLVRNDRTGSACIQVELESIALKTFRLVLARLRGIKEVDKVIETRGG